MDTMHAAVDETGSLLVACCTPPPAGIHKAYLTPLALLVSATAFDEGHTALAHTPSPAVFTARLSKASMAILYTVLWRWDELRSFARNVSMVRGPRCNCGSSPNPVYMEDTNL
jgi:hypothetical protein